jgi:hypothetical protein
MHFSIILQTDPPSTPPANCTALSSSVLLSSCTSADRNVVCSNSVVAIANYKSFRLADGTKGTGGEYDSKMRKEHLAYYNLHHPLDFFLWPQYS